MHASYLCWAVPLFVGLMVAEWWISRRRGLDLHQFGESVANLQVGIGERLCDLLTTGSFYFVFVWLKENVAAWTIPSHPLTWLLLFLFTDLLWYFYHRFGHEVNLFWSAHVVHHQSTDFNFTVSARITVFQAIARGLFWCWLPILGFDPHMITVLLLVHGAYPFFTHTQLVGKLGWLEKIFVTPSHHRVHHSSNPRYLDKNYGDVLIIWDKIFGTFQEEDEAPVYGLTQPLDSHSFLWQHFHFWLELGVALRRATGFKAKLAVLFGKPDDIDPRIRPWLERQLHPRKSRLPLSKGLQYWIGWRTINSLVVLFVLLALAPQASSEQIFWASTYVLLSCFSTGAMLEQKRWVAGLDLGRWVCAAAVLYTLYPSTFLLVGGGWLLVLLLALASRLQKQYLKILYGNAWAA